MRYLLLLSIALSVSLVQGLKVELVSGNCEVMRDRSGRKRDAYKTWNVPDECVHMFAHISHVTPESCDGRVLEYHKKMTPDAEYIFLTIHEPFAKYSDDQTLLFDAICHLIKMFRYMSESLVQDLENLYAPYVLHLVMIGEMLGLTSQKGYEHIPTLVEELLSTDPAMIVLWGPYLVECAQTSQRVGDIVGRVLRGESVYRNDMSDEARVALLVLLHNHIPLLGESESVEVKNLHAGIFDAVQDILRTPGMQLSVTKRRELVDIAFREVYQRNRNVLCASDDRRNSLPAAFWHSSGGVRIYPDYELRRKRASSSPVKLPRPPAQPKKPTQSSFRSKRLRFPSVGFSLQHTASRPVALR